MQFADESIPEDTLAQIEPFVGRVLLLFAMLDQALDFWLMCSFDWAKSDGIASRMPENTKPKIDLLKRVLSNEAMSRHTAKCIPLLEAAESLSLVRHTLAHGALAGYSAEPEPRLFFHRLKYSKLDGLHFHRLEPLTFAAIAKAADDLANLVRAVQGYTLVLGEDPILSDTAINGLTNSPINQP